MQIPLDVTPVGLGYLTLGGFVTLFSAISLLIKDKMYINEVVIGTGLGILMGPLCAGRFDPRSWPLETDTITLEFLRVVLVTGLFAIGVELPRTYIYKHMKGLLTMVIPTMAIGWVIVAGLIKGLFPRFDYITSLALAACLTPTDPIVSAVIIGGKYAQKHVPENIRHLLSAESAANDGLAYPFLSITLYLTLDPDRGKDIASWVVVGWLYQVILGILIGATTGYVFSHVLRLSNERGLTDRESFVAQYIALPLFTAGIVKTIGSDDLLAAFAAGIAVSWDGRFNEQTRHQVFAPVIEYILNCGCFFYIGAWLPWSDFSIPELGVSPWRLVLLCVAILVLRRIPAILILYKWVPEIHTWKEALFCGHFEFTFILGPMGVSAVFVSTYAKDRLLESQRPPGSQQEILAIALHPLVGFVVLTSIVVHGLSIPLFELGRHIRHRISTPTMAFATTGGNVRPGKGLLLEDPNSPSPDFPSSNRATFSTLADLEKGGTTDVSTSHSGEVLAGSQHSGAELPLNATDLLGPTGIYKVERTRANPLVGRTVEYGCHKRSDSTGLKQDPSKTMPDGSFQGHNSGPGRQ